MEMNKIETGEISDTFMDLCIYTGAAEWGL